MAPFESFIAGRGKDPEENERAREEAEVISGHHSENLYDQPEDAAGEKFDLRTGLPFVNDDDARQTMAHQMHAVEPESDDALPTLKEKDDAAARWLRENDPDAR